MKESFLAYKVYGQMVTISSYSPLKLRFCTLLMEITL